MSKIQIDEAVVGLALEALEKALRYQGLMLLSDPPQDAWKYHRVEQTAHEAITALRQALEQPAPAPAHEADELTIAYMSGLHEGKKRKPLTDEMILSCPYDAETLRGAYFDGWLKAEAAHGITKGGV